MQTIPNYTEYRDTFAELQMMSGANDFDQIEWAESRAVEMCGTINFARTPSALGQLLCDYADELWLMPQRFVASVNHAFNRRADQLAKARRVGRLNNGTLRLAA